MTDNVVLPGNDSVVSTDQIAGSHHQNVKIEFGDKDLATQVSTANPLPVTMASGPLPAGAATETTLASILTKLLGSIGVTGTFFQTTQPVSAASLPLPSGAATEATLGGVLTTTDFDTKVGSLTETAPATDTASSGLNGRLQRIAQRITSMITLLPAALGAGGGLKVDGSGTALPVSVASIPSHAVTNAGTFAVQATEADGANVTLGAKADAKNNASDTTSITIMQVLKQISFSIQGAAASLAGTLTVASHAVTNAGTFAVQSTLQAGSNTIGKIYPAFQTTKALTNAAITISSSGDNTIVSGTASQTIRVHKLVLVAAAAVNFTLKDGTAGTALTGAIPLTANGSFSIDEDGEPAFVSSSGGNFVVNLSGAQTVTGYVQYTKS